MKSIVLGVFAAALVAAPAMAADPVTRASAGTFPISASVTVPPGYTTIYVSGLTPSPKTPPAAGATPDYGNTEEQTESTIKKIADTLTGQGAGLGDVVQMHVYLVGDPTKGGKMDFAGMMAAYTRHFGTAEQPNKPSRTTVQVASLVGPGQMVEIEVIAVKPAK